MKRPLGASVAGVLLLIVTLAVPSAGVPLELTYTDPASDVVKLWSSNMTPVLNVNGEPFMSPFPAEINILRLHSTESEGGANVTLTLEVQGSIANLDNTSYEIRLYTRADNASHFIVSYANGSTFLDSNDTSFSAIDITGNSTVGSTGPNPTLQNALEIRVEKSLLGNLTAWNMDTTGTQIGPTYSYRDFGWEVPGSPGSAPTILYGIVTEVGVGTTLSGVNVSTDVGGYWTVTNTTGAYSLSISPGTYNVTFTLEGYGTTTLRVTVAAGDTRSLDAELSRLGLFEQGGNWLWVLLTGLSLALLLVATAVLLRRRKSRSPSPGDGSENPPAPLPPAQSGSSRESPGESDDGAHETAGLPSDQPDGLEDDDLEEDDAHQP